MTLATDTPAGGDLRFAFDGATDWPADEPLRVPAGWCFGTGAVVRGVELRVGGAVRAADYGLSRPDVAALHPGTPAAETSGFRIPLALPPGRHEIALVALRDGAAPALPPQTPRPSPPGGRRRRSLSRRGARVAGRGARRSRAVSPRNRLRAQGQHDLARALALLPPAGAARTRTFFVGDREGAYQPPCAAAAR